MRNLRVVESIDTGVAVWLLVSRANGERFAGLVPRGVHARCASPGDFLAIYNRTTLWYPRVLPAQAYSLGTWTGVPTISPPKLQKAPHLLMP